jgi:hypothetical protein
VTPVAPVTAVANRSYPSSSQPRMKSIAEAARSLEELPRRLSPNSGKTVGWRGHGSRTASCVSN